MKPTSPGLELGSATGSEQLGAVAVLADAAGELITELLGEEVAGWDLAAVLPQLASRMPAMTNPIASSFITISLCSLP
jgi:hypothetical protein